MKANKEIMIITDEFYKAPFSRRLYCWFILGLAVVGFWEYPDKNRKI